ncbi:R-spondin-3-like [Centruroides sculpturatus]|uniref:R-spondin-3-like n=1 Tax=Centruroides sculpturatus TaxID=218467 RepID=UPI000C6E6FBC|nr:R-spondin-3-like [Centruroides sculpturatus]
MHKADHIHYLFNGECVSECPDGYFANQYHHCQLCHITCLKCIGHEMGQCQACIQGYVLHGGNCLPDCPKGGEIQCVKMQLRFE